MFKKWIKEFLGIEDVHQSLLNLNNVERTHSAKLQGLMDNYKEDLIKVMAELEKTQKLLDEKITELNFTKDLLEAERKINEDLRTANTDLNNEIVRLTGIVDDDKKFKEDIKEYLQKVAAIATNIQRSTLDKNVNAKAYTKNNLAKETKVKLKWN